MLRGWGNYCVPRSSASSGTADEEVSASRSGMTERKLVVASW